MKLFAKKTAVRFAACVILALTVALPAAQTYAGDAPIGPRGKSAASKPVAGSPATNGDAPVGPR